MFRQLHGLLWERQVCDRLFGVATTTAAAYTCRYDIERGASSFFPHERVQIKTCKVAPSGRADICLGDALRVFDDSVGNVELTWFVLFYQQVGDKKQLYKIYDGPRPSHAMLFGELQRDTIARYDRLVKQLPTNTRVCASKYLPDAIAINRSTSGLAKLAPKVDSKSQRRVQLTFRDALRHFDGSIYLKSVDDAIGDRRVAASNTTVESNVFELDTELASPTVKLTKRPNTTIATITLQNAIAAFESKNRSLFTTVFKCIDDYFSTMTPKVNTATVAKSTVVSTTAPTQPFDVESFDRQLAMKPEFNISNTDKRKFADALGEDYIVQRTFKHIRENNVPLSPRLVDVPTEALTKAMKSAVAASLKAQTNDVNWTYGSTTPVAGTTGLIKVAPAVLTFSTLLNGNVRYAERVSSKGMSALDSWLNDSHLLATIAHCIRVTDAGLSVNRLKVHTLLGNGVRYATAFPIPVAMFIYRRQFDRTGGVPIKIVDPCAGWGDRLAAAVCLGDGVVENYVCIDPWPVSNSVCDDILRNGLARLTTRTPRTSVFTQGSEHCWPSECNGADLVFTSPPYCNLECYGMDAGGSVTSVQAWRFGTPKLFCDSFITPMLRNAKAALNDRPESRIIININDLPKGLPKGTPNLIECFLESVATVGLRVVEVLGMSVSVRAPTAAKDTKAEPLFVLAK